MLAKVFGEYGLPADAFAWSMLLLALLLALPRVARGVFGSSARQFLACSMLAAAALSLLYSRVYLHGQPRIIDATTYALQARAFAHGELGLPLPAVEASAAGRFVLTGDAGVVGIFPPGYPMYLAAFVALGAAWLAGPALAAALVAGTYALARTAKLGEFVARIAAGLSVACGALRYHTADSMAHALSAALIACGFVCALSTRAKPSAGIALGALTAAVALTRFASALPLLFACCIYLQRATPRQASAARWGTLRAGARLALGAALPAALGIWYFRRATGAYQLTTQSMYYALSDFPNGCFRYGFGQGIGCRYEHTDFVAAQLPSGFDAFAALKTTLRRLVLLPSDIANWGPLAALPLAFAPRLPAAARLLGYACIVQIIAYVPFYFDGNYPGGGARMYADSLPLAHVVLAGCCAEFGLALQRRWPQWKRLAEPHVAFVVISMLGFALHAAFEHRKLRDRDGGAAFLPAAARALPPNELLLVDNAAAFNLGFGATEHAAVARWHNDAHDALLWERSGRPRAHLLRAGQVLPLEFPQTQVLYTFSAAALWPARALQDASAVPTFESTACAAAGAGLKIRAGSNGQVRLRQALPSQRPLNYEIRFAGGGGEHGTLEATLLIGSTRSHLRAPPESATSAAAGCQRLAARVVANGDAALELQVAGDWVLVATSAAPGD